MAKLTRRDILRAALLARGYRSLGLKGRYERITTDREDRLYFLGSNGALRYGRAATASTSLSESTLYKNLLLEGHKLLAKPAAPPVMGLADLDEEEA